MLATLLVIFMLGSPMFKPGDMVQVPDFFYRRIETIEGVPESYSSLQWGEGRFGNWLEATTARGPAAVETIEKRLGPPLALPKWGIWPAREGYLFPTRTSVEAGLLIVVDRRRSKVELLMYATQRHPIHIIDRPPSNEWELNLMRWFRWLTTPDEQLDPALREAAKDGFPPFRATGIDPITGEREGVAPKR